MAENNQITIRNYLATPAIVKRVETLLNKRASQFTTSVLALANSDPKIMSCEPSSLFNACLTAASLDLPINKNLGFAHIIPYNDTKKGITEAQFQMGWKGFVQLAQRSGQYKTISSTEVYEGQLVSADPLRGNVYNWSKKTSDTIVGYVSIIVLTNGFEHELYMSHEDMEAHALKYSQSYRSTTKWVKENSPWTTNFPAMAAKTVIKLNISKFGPMSVELERALVNDQAVIRDDGAEYVDGTDLLDEERGTEDQKAAIVAEHSEPDDKPKKKTKAEEQAAKAFNDDLTDEEKAEIEADEQKAASK